MLRSIDSLSSLTDKDVVVRVDFNVPMSDGVISDDSRIRSSLPTIKELLSKGPRSIVLISHLGRPKGAVTPSLSLNSLLPTISKLLDIEVLFAKSIAEVQSLQEKPIETSAVILFENIRFDLREEKDDAQFGKELSGLGSIYVNDAFGAAHRAHASTHAITKHMSSYAGLLLEKEFKNLSIVLENPKHPYIAVIGGAKVSTKIAVLESLSKRCDTIIIGGAMAYTFLHVLGHKVGKSIVENTFLETAERFLESAEREQTTVLLPVDHIASEEFSSSSKGIEISEASIPDHLMALDIGQKSQKIFTEEISRASCVVWNGPMGVFEFPSFETGTKIIGHTIAKNKQAITVCGGGDTLAAIQKWSLGEEFTHVSTGGGASLEFLEGRQLPALQVLMD